MLLHPPGRRKRACATFLRHQKEAPVWVFEENDSSGTMGYRKPEGGELERRTSLEKAATSKETVRENGIRKGTARIK